MVQRTLNLGILAHVDAGKTTLTERLLHAAGVIDEIGSVDAGTTQTDTLALERERGITIKSAVVSFAIGGVAVNLIDTPGHPDFIAEVERALAVLDGAVLVVSAVEGVQPQTRILWRALRRLEIPTLIFVNKIDRRGADDERTLRAIAERLTPAAIRMGSVGDVGSRAAAFLPMSSANSPATVRLAEVLAEQNDSMLTALVNGERTVPYRTVRKELAAQTRTLKVHPVFFGSAVTGAGVGPLMAGIAELLPPARRDLQGPACGAVFKIERAGTGEKIAFVRMFSGSVGVRERVRFGATGERRVTGIEIFDRGGTVQRPSVIAGEIAKVRGLAEARVGDAIGARGRVSEQQFAPPTLDAVVVARHPRDRSPLRAALAQLAEQDPLIDVRQDDVRREIHMSLFGEVQKEVVAATLEADFGVPVEFRETTTIHVERPVGTGAAVERLGEHPNPFVATVGLRIEPAPSGSGVTFRIEAELGAMPLAFFRAVEETVRSTLREGLHGWEVIDCEVLMTDAGYLAKHSLGHARFTKSISSTGEDFRKLTPLVLMAALQRARTTVCAPIHRFRLEAPADLLGTLVPALARIGAIPRDQVLDRSVCVITGDVPAARIHDLRRRLPALTRGEGVLESVFDRYEPVRGVVPTRPRSDLDPLNRAEYLLRVAGRPVARPKGLRAGGS
jgi:ribosomal protection tetracycline resistance protein